MVDPIILMVIGFYYAFDMLVNLLGVIILSLTMVADDQEFRDVVHERVVDLMNEDKNFYYRSTLLLIINSAVLYMIIPLSATVSVILGLGLVLNIANMILSLKVKNNDQARHNS
jgi:hypothetical protein